MLLQNAPRLLGVIQQGGGLEAMPNVAEALSRGYDTGLMEEHIGTNPLTGEFDVAGPVSNLDSLYDSLNESPADKIFPSDYSDGLDILSIAEGKRFGENPAEISAGNMLAQGIPSEADIPPYPGGLSEVDHLSNEIDNLPNSPYRDSLIDKMNKLAKPTKASDLFYQLVNQPSYR